MRALLQQRLQPERAQARHQQRTDHHAQHQPVARRQALPALLQACQPPTPAQGRCGHRSPPLTRRRPSFARASSRPGAGAAC
ncbi:hypothetical protein G6F62_015868 [Rhizopus arrhizus]|nr:hypothetical protein G6F62_015868 [Rhizopus arrhizus]